MPDWLRTWVPAVWCDRSSHRFEEYRVPPSLAARAALAEQLGTDGPHLLRAVYDPATPCWLRAVPAVQTVRQVWVQQFHAPDWDGRIHWRTADDVPPAARLIRSPYDPAAAPAENATPRGLAITSM